MPVMKQKVITQLVASIYNDCQDKKMSESYLPFKNVESPVRLKELSKLDPRCKVIQFDTPLTKYDFLTLSDFL